MSAFDPRLEILPPAQLAIWPQLAPSIDLGLVLYGGTAIALRLGHRASVDFDFFTEKPLDRAILESAFPFLKTATVLQSQRDTLGVLVPSSPHPAVNLSFFGDINIGRTGQPELTADGVLEVASLLDLLATKLNVIQQRIEAKDYHDVAAILRFGMRLEDGLAATALYRPAFQPVELLKSITCFDEGDLSALSTEDRNTLAEKASAVVEVPVIGRLSDSLSNRT